MGVNLLPPGEAFCTYRCVYCPLSPFIKPIPSPAHVPNWLSAAEIASALANALELLRPFRDVEAIVLIGNGEPTLHPQLEDVMSEVGEVRDAYAPRARLAVFTNSSLLADEGVAEALSNADYVVAKLDAVEEELRRAINRPHPNLPSLSAMIKGLMKLRELLSDKMLVISMSALELQSGASNLSDDHLRKMVHVLMEIGPGEVHIEVPPASLASAFKPPPKEALIEAVIELSDAIEKVFLLTGTSSPIPAELLKHVAPYRVLEEKRAVVEIPEPVKAFLSEGPGARTRLRLLETLSTKKMSCNRLAKKLGMSWWSIKKHIERLVELGLVRPIPFGKRVLYAITPLGISALMALKSGAEEVSAPLRLL